MPTHKLMTQKDGDKPFEFDTKDAVAVAEAEARFKDLVGKGFAPYTPDGKGGGTVSRTFDPAADVVFVPQRIGG